MDDFGERSNSADSVPSDEDYYPHTIPRSAKSARTSKTGHARSKSIKEPRCSSRIVLEWLEENYKMSTGSCLPRCVIYTHYQDFCKRHSLEPQSAASFGKTLRLKFPNLSTRRLGTRGQSKYHYYGLAIKETSIYYKCIASKRGITRFANSSSKKEVNAVCTSSKSTSMLPLFPNVHNMTFSQPFPVDKLDTFMLMYRAHCQRILDSITRSNFYEVQEFLMHFWKGMPSHMLSILSCQITLDLILVCDCILYRAICEALIPSSLHSIPDSNIEDMKFFAKNLVEWLFHSLSDLPPTLNIIKIQAAEAFSRSLRRQLSLLHYGKDAKRLISSMEFITSVVNDLHHINVFPLYYKVQTEEKGGMKLIKKFMLEFKQLLMKQCNVDGYFVWIDGIFESELKKVSTDSEKLDICKHIIRLWNQFVSHLNAELSTCQARSKDGLQSLLDLLTEYFQYLTEFIQSEFMENQYIKMLQIHSDSSPVKIECHDQKEDSKCVAADLNASKQLMHSIQPHIPSQKSDIDESEYLEQNEMSPSNCINLAYTQNEDGYCNSKRDLDPIIDYSLHDSADYVPLTPSSSSGSSFSLDSPLLDYFSMTYHFQSSFYPGDFDSGIDAGPLNGSISSGSSDFNDLDAPLSDGYDMKVIDFMDDTKELLSDPFSNILAN